MNKPFSQASPAHPSLQVHLGVYVVTSPLASVTGVLAHDPLLLHDVVVHTFLSVQKIIHIIDLNLISRRNTLPQKSDRYRFGPCDTK